MSRAAALEELWRIGELCTALHNHVYPDNRVRVTVGFIYTDSVHLLRRAERVWRQREEEELHRKKEMEDKAASRAVARDMAREQREKEKKIQAESRRGPATATTSARGQYTCHMHYLISAP